MELEVGLAGTRHSLECLQQYQINHLHCIVVSVVVTLFDINENIYIYIDSEAVRNFCEQMLKL